MGQESSIATEKTPKLKKLTIQSSGKSILLQDIPRSLTISSLLSRINQILSNPTHPVISLTTSDKTECLNYYLSMPERNLIPLQNEETLSAVFYSKVPSRISISCFEIIQVIGRGSYSIVSQVRKKDTGMIYALKSIEKCKILKENLKSHIMAERDILSSVKSPFVAKLRWAFQTRNKLHFLMDFYPGGELYTHLKNIRQFTESQAKFYFAEILLGLRSLHRKEIAYRDLKPENIVIDVDGHVRLTDFGLSRLDMYENSMSFCGSPEYMSPEILLGEGHSKTVDYYCLGALLYEMLLGLPPFYDRDENKMHNRVLNEELALPDSVSEDCKSILKGLLAKDPFERLGASGAREVMRHPWCKDIKWSEFKKKNVKPPLTLNMRKSYFDKRTLACPVGFLSDTEALDNDFGDFDFNLDCRHDDISRFYFESNNNPRSLSQSSKRLSLNKKLEVFSGLSTQVSPFLSPADSLNSSYMGDGILGETMKTPKKFGKRGLLVLSEMPPARKSITALNSPRDEHFGDKLRNSVFSLFSKGRRK